MLATLRRTLANYSNLTQSLAYSTLVRPHLEQASAVLDSQVKFYSKILEGPSGQTADSSMSNFKQLSSVTAMMDPLGSLRLKMSSKTLVAMDFDHTIIEGNSDMHIQKLSPDGFPEEVTKLFSRVSWTDYMGAIFQHLHSQGVTQQQILDCMDEIPLVEGMAELFEFLRGDAFDTIIISDSNSVFIEQILKTKGLQDIVGSVYTNPAQFEDDDCLQIAYYHEQDWCDLSTRNLCKGHILDSFIEEQAAKGTQYNRVAYVGDGTNDLCPCLRLKPTDLALPREGFRLEQKILQGELPVKAKVTLWRNGLEIKDALMPSSPL